MKIFLDSADVDEIERFRDLIDGVTTNPTLIRQAIERRKGTSLREYVAEICERAGKGRPVSLEVASVKADGMIEEARALYDAFNGIAGNVVIKIPVNVEPLGDLLDGIKAIREVSRRGIPVNATLIMTPSQALLAARAGASYVSPFVGRVDDFIRKNLGMSFRKEDYYDYSAVQRYKEVLSNSSKDLSEHLRVNDIEGNMGVLSGIDLVRRIRIIFSNYGVRSQIIAASIRHVRQVFEAMEVGTDIATVPAYVLEEMLRHPKTEEGVRIFAEDSERANYREVFRS
ncbi:MAG: transaldolase family protein [Nitrososphaeria archaeon]